MIQIDNIMAVG